jgi:hypothetical protein
MRGFLSRICSKSFHFCLELVNSPRDMLDIYCANDRCLELKTANVRPKKMRVSYAAVVGRKKPSKQPANSNHRAYRAWEDRREKIKRMEMPSSQETKLNQQKVDGFTALFRQLKVLNISLYEICFKYCRNQSCKLVAASLI